MLLALVLLLLCPVAFAAQAPHTSESGFPIDRVPLPISTFPNDLVSIEEQRSSSEETNSSKNSQNPHIYILKNSQIEATPKNCSNTSKKSQNSSRKNFQKPQISPRKNSGIEYLKKNQSGGDQDSEDSSNEDGSTSEDDSRLQSFLQFVIVTCAVLGLMVVNRLFRRRTERNGTTESESQTGTSRTIAANTSNGPPATAFSYVMQLLDAHPEICRLCLLVALYFWPSTHWWWGLIVWFMLFQFW